jgi:hypothetical protein
VGPSDNDDSGDESGDESDDESDDDSDDESDNKSLLEIFNDIKSQLNKNETESFSVE